MKNLERLFSIIHKKNIQDLTLNKEKITRELQRLSIRKKNQQDLFNKILEIVQISNNQQLRESYLRSYFRLYREKIKTDGRDSSIVIEITKRCQKNCLHCYSKHTGRRKDMTDEILSRIIHYARTHIKHIFLTGGEPTLDPRLFTIAEKNPDILFFFFTNGSTMTRHYAHKISAYGNLIPLLGIDGATHASHDFLRGKGSYREVLHAIDALQRYNVPWGYISLVTEQNAHNVLSNKFITEKTKKGAFIARYLEYLPVGPYPLRELILSGSTYYYLEKRKQDIIKSGIIYMQETMQKKCRGLLFFDVDGNIKNCFCFHYSKYNIKNGHIPRSVENLNHEWISYKWKGECPIYSDPIGFKNHLEHLGWKKTCRLPETYLTDMTLATQLMGNYQRFLQMKTQKKL